MIIAQSLGLALATAGAWAIGVRPLGTRLREHRAELASVREQEERIRAAFASETLSTEEAGRTVFEHANRLQELSAVSVDPSNVYEAIGALAKHHGARIERMEPKRGTAGTTVSGSTRSAKQRGRSKESEKNAGPAIDSYGYSIDASGSYASVASLIDSIEHETGLSSVVSFRLAPARGDDGLQRVRASIDSAHFALRHPLTHTDPKEGGQ